MPDRKEFMVEDAHIIFRNFEGKEGPMNRKGDRNFCILLNHETAEQMLADGWNIKFLQAKEEGEEDQPYIPVAVSYRVKPPRIVTITSGGKTQLSESQVEVLDFADIKMVDVFCTGYDWEVGGKTGTKAYVKTMFVTLEEDALERKYAIYSEPAMRSDDE